MFEYVLFYYLHFDLEVLSLTMPLKVKMLILCSKSVINPFSTTRLRKRGKIGHDKSLKVEQYNVY